MDRLMIRYKVKPEQLERNCTWLRGLRGAEYRSTGRAAVRDLPA